MGRNDEVFLGIDAGTTKIKLTLYGAGLNEIGSSAQNVRVYADEPGASEIDMDELWQDLCAAARALQAAYPGPWSQLRGVGISGQGDGLWPLDGAGRPACRAMLWNDTRSKELGIDETQGLNELLAAQCMNPIFAGSMPALQKWLKRFQPEVYARIRHSLHCKDYLNYKLTGRIASDYSDITCSSGMNIKTLKYVPELYEMLEIPEALSTMPEAVEPTQVLARVSAQASAQCGIAAGVPVIAGCLDCCAVSVGTDFYEERQACTIIGTSMISERCLSREQIDPEDLRGLLLYHVAKGRYIKIMNSAGGASVTDAVKRMLCPDEPFEELFERLKKIPVGSRGVLFHPYLFGERAPFKNPYAFGSFFGLRSHHNKYDLMRAAYEGLAMACMDAYQGAGPIDVVYLSGGASVSPFVCQMFADALGRPARRAAAPELGTLGVAKMLMVALGYAGDFSAFNTGGYAEYEPDEARHVQYRALFEAFAALRASVSPHWTKEGPGRWGLE